MSKPIIGIVEWPYYDQDGDKIYEVFNDVVNWVIRSGGIPVGIFPTQIEDFVEKRLREIEVMNGSEYHDLVESINRCDAIIKPGAWKIYNHERLIHKYTLEKNMPYLGICAGMQIMAAYGQEQINNVKNETNINHHQPGYGHEVCVYKNSLLHRLVNKETFKVYSRHNYHIASCGINKVSAISSDGIIEAIENPNATFQLGVQWHPELAPTTDKNSARIFEGLVEAAEDYSKQKIKR